jgi:Leucine-rich repeat (LRR) protein
MDYIEKKILSDLSASALNLTESGLTQIPTSIGQLTNLKILDLSENRLSEIPASIGQLTNLQKLWLNNNQIKTIPISLQNLTLLQELDLRDNNLQFPFSPYERYYSDETPTELFQLLKDISTPSEKWTQIKLVTIGHGGVGKVFLFLI